MNQKPVKVAIISRESDRKTLDVAMLEEELNKRGAEVKTLCRLLTKERSVKALGYAGHIARQEAAILWADAVVLDTYCIPASMIPHGSRTKIVQMWHALGAIKKFGWQTVGSEDGTSERTASLMRMHRGYDHVICSSGISAEHFCEAFRVSEDRIAKYGLPRIDYIKSVSSGERREDMLRRIYSRYPELKNSSKKIVLYAPTFRRNESVDTESLIKAVDTDRYELVIKLHPLYRNQTGDKDREEKAGVIFDEDFSSYDWLAAADTVISDYSSFVIESALADKPLYIYTYDIDRYRGSTGLNMDFDKEPVSDYVFSDAASLAAALDKPYDIEKLRQFRDRYIDINTENCTAALADFILSLKEK